MRIRRTPALLLALVTAAGPAAVVGAAPATAHERSGAAASAPFCGIRWGSLDKQDLTRFGGAASRVRAGRHACFDRLVVDFRGGGQPPGPGWSVRYVDRVTEDPSDRPVPLSGGARLQVVTVGTGREAGAPATGTAVDVRGFRTLRDVKWAGDFEGHVSLGVGVRARLPFRAFTLDGPGPNATRLVIDVAHRW